MTAHKLLYYCGKDKEGNFIFKPKERLENDYKLVIVDEVSMIPYHMWNLLLSHNVHVIALGDPMQLPPVQTDENEPTLDILQHPHIFLDEVMRQAAESEIIRLSMDIREGKSLPTFRGEEVMILPPSNFNNGMYIWADQILVATNARRKQINDTVRKIKGFGPEPQDGDKVISLYNHWNITAYNTDANLINGTIGYISNPYQETIPYRLNKSIINVPTLQAIFTSEINDNFGFLGIDYNSLTLGKKFLTPKQEYAISKTKNNNFELPLEFDYAYAITCHKSQGSEWDKVLVFEEHFPWDKEEHKKHLYTSCTRAAKKLVLIRNE